MRLIKLVPEFAINIYAKRLIKKGESSKALSILLIKHGIGGYQIYCSYQFNQE